MIPLLAALVLVQSGPTELNLAIEKATPINDSAVASFPPMTHWEARGRVVADDGSTIFEADNALVYMPMGWSFYMKDRPGVIDVVSAADRSRLVVLRQTKPDTFEVASLALEGTDKVLCGPDKGQQPGRPIPDLSSEALLVPYTREDKTGVLRMVNGSAKAEFPARPGYVPFAYDSMRDLLLGYTYSEHGGQDRLLLRNVGKKEDVKIPRTKGEIGISALLPDGRILTTYKRPASDDESPDSQFGIYECAPPYGELKYLGPYQIQGSSRNGKYLLISHQTQRKSWLVALK